jgi:hypothetical protein
LFKQDIIDFVGMLAGMFVCVETLGLHHGMIAVKRTLVCILHLVLILSTVAGKINHQITQQHCLFYQAVIALGVRV